MKKESLFKRAYKGLLKESPSPRLGKALYDWVSKKTEQQSSKKIKIVLSSNNEELIPYEWFETSDGELVITVVTQDQMRRK